MRLEATVRGRSVTIWDCEPLWHGAPGEWLRLPIAQLRHDPATELWTLHWADRNSRWHRYDDVAPTADVTELIREIDEDPTCIFFG